VHRRVGGGAEMVLEVEPALEVLGGDGALEALEQRARVAVGDGESGDGRAELVGFVAADLCTHVCICGWREGGAKDEPHACSKQMAGSSSFSPTPPP
jgi:hypothetical protein